MESGEVAGPRRWFSGLLSPASPSAERYGLDEARRPSVRGVLFGDVLELDVLTDGAAERLVVGHTGIVESLQVELDEPLTLLVGDLQVAMHVDDVPKTELIGKSWRAAKRLSGEPGQVVDVGGNGVRE